MGTLKLWLFLVRLAVKVQMVTLLYQDFHSLVKVRLAKSYF